MTLTAPTQLLGKIFYAATKADKVIRAEEIERFNDFIFTEWQSQDISRSFYDCINLSYDTNSLWDEIQIHKQQQADFFDEETCERIIKTAYGIVNSFSGVNKSEIVFISRLRNALFA